MKTLFGSEKLQPFVGKIVTLKSGERVQISTIAHSFRYASMAVINEEHFIDYLSLFSQVMGQTPTIAEKIQWEKLTAKLQAEKDQTSPKRSDTKRRKSWASRFITRSS